MTTAPGAAVTGPAPAYQVPDEARARLRSLGMEGLLDDLARDGYAFVRDAADPAFVARLRGTILRLAVPGGPAAFSATAAALLGQDPVFEEAILNPKVQALVHAMCGEGAMLSALQGSVRHAGPQSLGLHCDQSWMPSPYPEHPYFFTLCWALDEFTEENGATGVIPGSHLKRRYPTPAEQADARMQPMTCAAGEIACWLGTTWHGSFPRTTPGERVVLHMAFCRLAVRPVENYDHLDEAWLAGKPAELRTLLGREDFFDKPGIDYTGGEYERRALQTGRWGRAESFRIPA